MNKIRRNIPNAITCGNLFCGCLAIVKAFEGDLVWAAYLVGIAAVFDFLDGFAARMLRASSPIGKDLDSLADMVTFGVVPGVVVFQLLIQCLGYSHLQELKEASITDMGALWEKANFTYGILPYAAFAITLFSAIRLAKFNNDTRQTESFIGLPTPANAIFFCSLPLLLKQITDSISRDKNPFEILIDTSSNPVLALLNNAWFLLILVSIFSILLVAPLPLFSLKFKSFGWKGNEIRFTFLLLSIVMITVLKFLGIPLVIVLYILMSVIQNLFLKTREKS